MDDAVSCRYQGILSLKDRTTGAGMPNCLPTWHGRMYCKEARFWSGSQAMHPLYRLIKPEYKPGQ